MASNASEDMHEDTHNHNAGAKDASAESDIVLSQDYDGRLKLHLGGALRADVLDLSLMATPPGKYVNRSKAGRISWGKSPQEFSFNKVDEIDGHSTYMVEEAHIASGIPFGSRVDLASDDGFLVASATWKIKPRASALPLILCWALVALLVVPFGVASVMGWRLSQAEEYVCDRLSFCSAEQISIREVRNCGSQVNACGAASCTEPFRKRYPSSRFMNLVQRIESEDAERCRAEDEDKFANVSLCVQQKINSDPCNVPACFLDYDITKVPERASQAQTIIGVSAERCRVVKARADQEVNPPQPPVASVESEQVVPLPALPPPVLSDGSYPAVQRYTGLRGRSDPLNCPPNASFVVDVKGDKFSYSKPDIFDGASITRTWVGSIDQVTGQVAILGSRGNPSTKNAMTIVGPYDNATVLSDFCGAGVFSIKQRQ